MNKARQYQKALQEDNYEEGLKLHQQSEHLGIYADTYDRFDDGSVYKVSETFNIDIGHGFEIEIIDKEV